MSFRHIIALVLAVPGIARAQSEAPLTVEVAPGSADVAVLERELERDLGVEVEVVDGGARLRVVLTDSRVRLELVREGRPPLAREVVDVPAELGARTIEIALIAANLVRDESVELLALLRVEPAPEEPPEGPRPPIVIVAPEAPLAEEPPAEAPSEIEETEPERDEPAEPPLDDVPVAIDFAPGLGMSTGLWGRDRRYVSLGIIGALMGGLRGLSLDGVADIVLGSVEGAQIAGVLGVADRVVGVQLTGVMSLSLRGVEGAQLGTIAIAGGELRGAQLGIVDVVGGRLSGLQGSVVGVVGGAVAGAQLGVVNVAGGPTYGAQLGVVNVVGQTLEGAQLGVVNVNGGAADGAQLGVVNIAGGGVSGLQLGVVNIAGGVVRGVQIGVVNIAEDADASIGLVGIYPRGRTQIRGGADTTGLIRASLIHGPRHTHTIVSIAVQPFQERPAFLAGLGFGARAIFDEALHLDFDALAHWVIDERVSNGRPGLLAEARVVFGARVLDAFGLYAGIGYQMHIDRDREEGGLGGPVLTTEISSSVHGWPVLMGGVELF